MRWEMGRRSGNVEDRRGTGYAARGGRRDRHRHPARARALLRLRSGRASCRPDRRRPASTPASPRADSARDFVSVVLADTEDTWRELFRRMNREYRDPKLVLFTGSVQSACGIAGSAVGPFYCPQDEKRLPGPRLLPRPRRALRRAGRLRPGVRDRARGGPPRPELARRLARHRPGRPRRQRTRLRAARAAGRLLRGHLGAPRRSHRGTCSSRATSRKAWPRPPPSATTGCSAARRAASRPNRSRTARRSSARAGSSAATRRATSPSATRSAPARCSRSRSRPAAAPRSWCGPLIDSRPCATASTSPPAAHTATPDAIETLVTRGEASASPRR